MHSRFNTRLNNNDEKQGNIASYFDNLKNLVQINDGTRSFVLKTVDCHDQSAPFNDSQETRIAITHSDHMISQITDGFLTFKVKLMLQLRGEFHFHYMINLIVSSHSNGNNMNIFMYILSLLMYY